MPVTSPVHHTGSTPAGKNPAPGDLTCVEIGPEGFAVERYGENGEWERLGVYADFATADEIVRIASADPDAGLRDGSSPDRAVPFSSLGAEDDGWIPEGDGGAWK